MGKSNDHTYISNTACKYFPCHTDADIYDFNCLFCYCPLYALGEHCGGNFSYTGDGIKDCSACLLPHMSNGYKHILDGCKEVIAMVRKKSDAPGGKP